MEYQFILNKINLMIMDQLLFIQFNIKNQIKKYLNLNHLV